MANPQVAASREHALAVTRDYISQPHLSEWRARAREGYRSWAATGKQEVEEGGRGAAATIFCCSSLPPPPPSLPLLPSFSVQDSVGGQWPSGHFGPCEGMGRGGGGGGKWVLCSTAAIKGAVRRVAHAHYDTLRSIKPDSRPDGTAIRDHARVRVYTSSRERRCATNCESE